MKDINLLLFFSFVYFASVSVPAEIYEFDDVTQQEETRAMLVCLARGDPAPDMILLKINDLGQHEVVSDLVSVPCSEAHLWYSPVNT